MTMSSMVSTKPPPAAGIELPPSMRRYQAVTEKKADGATYTPKILADFVAKQILAVAELPSGRTRIRIMDPAVGDGELLISLLSQMSQQCLAHTDVFGFETAQHALCQATTRIKRHFPAVNLLLEQRDFLEFVLTETEMTGVLFGQAGLTPFDLIIANPPYVRTQIMGASQAQLLSRQFGLGGRVDLYYAFLLAMGRVLQPGGTCGVIVSNRFMTTKSGAAVRHALRESFDIHHVWDLGDTKLFDAAILPAVLLVRGKTGQNSHNPRFTSIYQTHQPAVLQAVDPMAAILREGTIAVTDGRHFQVQHGHLDLRGAPDVVWRIGTDAGDSWLATVQANTWGTFRDIGKTRVGVKTCADSVFIRDDWHRLPAKQQPELLRPLVTHHIARRFRACIAEKPLRILYPHQIIDGCRVPADLGENPGARAYLESHRAELESRGYVLEAGRKWYEIWVPQDPAAWIVTKLVFRDISEKPTFWIDKEGSVVNGDCYWLIAGRPQDEHLLWLALAVANSTFAEAFYDRRFHNKLYAGRRRFMTQYVEQFPLPDPARVISQSIIAQAHALYQATGTPQAQEMDADLNRCVWQAFGLPGEKIAR